MLQIHVLNMKTHGDTIETWGTHNIEEHDYFVCGEENDG